MAAPSRLAARRDRGPPNLGAEAERLREEGRRSRRERPATQDARPPRARRPPRPPATDAPLSVSSLVFGLLLAVLGASTYLLWRQDDGKAGALERHDQRLVVLERGLSSTSETFSDVQRKTDTSLSGVEQRVGDNAGEVKKLWDMAWRRNQGDIERQSQALEQTQKTLLSAQRRLTGAQAEIKQTNDSLSKLSERAQNLERSDNGLEEELSEVLVGINDIRRELRGIGAEQAKIRSALAELARWRRSVDSYRRDVNSRLDELRSRLVAR